MPLLPPSANDIVWLTRGCARLPGKVENTKTKQHHRRPSNFNRQNTFLPAAAFTSLESSFKMLLDEDPAAVRLSTSADF